MTSSSEMSIQGLDLGIESLLSGYRDKSLSPFDVISTVYDRIEAYPDKAVWISLVTRQEALVYTQSLVAKHTAGGGELPPLFGVPFSVKDSIDIAGYPTTLACPSFAYKAERTALVVQKILDAGAVLVGKTNLDQFATGLNGTRSPYGAPRCVYDSKYISGGSSSGSVVSVAASLVSFTVGTDTAGSTRVPAALNGVVGLKPTLGSISTVGLVPACKNADCVTIMARKIGDAKAAWAVMRGFDEEDVYARRTPPSWPWKWPAADRIRFGVPPASLLTVLCPEYASLFSTAVQTLTDSLGLVPSPEFDYGTFAEANDMLYGSSVVAQRLVAFDEYIQTHGLEQLHPAVRSIFAASGGFDAVRAYQDIFALAGLRRRAEQQFRDGIDVLVVPSTVQHFTVEEMEAEPLARNRLLGSFSHFVNLLDLCAVAVPTGTWTNASGNKMPFGVTLIAQAGRDDELMELGGRLMAACGW
ncbi:Amidase [Pleurostoma richardsiae]|uniref:Amidase n=1 Tax=Pleurostoma richardsiae TaxID=41990 RepID=A0AA38RNF8_9PEZI|nr:Amidase [Pleurostoma richardsiae]